MVIRVAQTRMTILFFFRTDSQILLTAKFREESELTTLPSESMNAVLGTVTTLHSRGAAIATV